MKLWIKKFLSKIIHSSCLFILKNIYSQKKFIKFKGNQFINKKKLSVEINKLNSLNTIQTKRSPKLIVSLTSYPARMADIHYTLYSLLNQSCKPDEVILWLAEKQFPNRNSDLPEKVNELAKYGLSIKYCNDIRSYKKLVPSLKEYPDDIIVTADDDLFYPQKWLEYLYEEYLSNKENILCHRAHRITFNNENEIAPYNKWQKCITTKDASYKNLLTGCGGVLYPPNSLYKDVLDENLFQNLSPMADDLWFWAMAVLNDRKIKIIENQITELIYVNIERELGLLSSDVTLNAENVHVNRNDVQISNVLQYYPQILEKLKTEYVMR